MFDQIAALGRKLSHIDDGTTSLREFVCAHQEALFNAASLLAGRRGGRLVIEVADELARNNPAISTRCRRRMNDLLDILALENVHDPDRDESGFFAQLDPASPIVEELCLLTDQYREAVQQADTAQPPASRSRAAA